MFILCLLKLMAHGVESRLHRRCLATIAYGRATHRLYMGPDDAIIHEPKLFDARQFMEERQYRLQIPVVKALIP